MKNEHRQKCPGLFMQRERPTRRYGPPPTNRFTGLPCPVSARSSWCFLVFPNRFREKNAVALDMLKLPSRPFLRRLR